MKKYTYSRTVNFSRRENGEETFTAVEFDSFDEAVNAVDKGVYEKQLKDIERQNKKSALNPNPPAMSVSFPLANQGFSMPATTTSNPAPADAPPVPGPNLEN